VVPPSDGAGEFGEGGRQPTLWIFLYTELVVAASKVGHWSLVMGKVGEDALSGEMAGAAA
jgi:hypothetical protein